ncbi:MAG: DUF58 domain-containing protein [Bacteroidetes bacterium]|nr:DUF58 domain-containing protein [Bacteroidota bacterium]
MEEKLKYLKPEILSTVSSMELRAKFVVEGFLTGLHKSPYHGFSVEFSEHRQYLPGDDLRKLDWKILAKTDRFYIKQFEEETNLAAHIFIDTSASMGYASEKNKITKLKYAAYLAASLSYLMNKQKDAVGLGLYDSKLHKYLSPKTSKTHLNILLSELENMIPSQNTNAAVAIGPYIEKIKRKGLIILISDLFDSEENTFKLFKQLRYNGHEVIIFQILDDQEVEFEFTKNTNFIDLESTERIITSPIQIKTEYKRAVENYLSKIKTNCYQHKIDYSLIKTSTTFDVALLQYLNKREQLN